MGQIVLPSIAVHMTVVVVVVMFKVDVTVGLFGSLDDVESLEALLETCGEVELVGKIGKDVETLGTLVPIPGSETEAPLVELGQTRDKDTEVVREGWCADVPQEAPGLVLLLFECSEADRIVTHSVVVTVSVAVCVYS